MSRSLWAVFLAAIFWLLSWLGESNPSGFATSPTLGEEYSVLGNFPPNVGGTGATQSQPKGLPLSISATTSSTATIRLSDLPVGKVIQVGTIKFVKVGADQYLAINLCPEGSTYSSTYKGCVVKQTDFTYTGKEQTFTAPADGYYALEVWGAQGGAGYIAGGYGGYALGMIKLSRNVTAYINIGGTGISYQYNSSGNNNGGYGSGGYNGGGDASPCNAGKGGSGGGATHIAFVSGLLRNLSKYATDGNIIIVAGGGGGSGDNNRGGNGGGYIGNKGAGDSTYATGGTQTEGGKDRNGWDGIFGLATASQSIAGGLWCGQGGGGGYYGGGRGFQNQSGAGGGSGYIGSSNLVSLTNFAKHMTCYECTTSTAVSTYTISNTCVNADPVMDCSKMGHGAARITQLSVYLGI